MERRAKHSCKAFFSGILLILLLVSPYKHATAQRKSDIGIIGGASYYMGDINHGRHFYSPSPAGGIIYRYNLNPRHSFRFNMIYASLKGSDSDFADEYQLQRNRSFKTSIIDLAITTEFNFRDYTPSKLRKNRYSPYVSAGIGYASLISSNVNASSSATIQFGGGFKYNLSRRWSMGAEWTFRKNLNDLLDGTENIGAEQGVFFHNNDWYSIIGLFITYKIFNWREDCPAYD